MNYLNLIRSQANRYRSSNVDLDDLVQEGFMGLAHALPRFKKSKGVEFSTYATFWIRKFILTYISKEYRERDVQTNARHWLDTFTFDSVDEMGDKDLLTNLLSAPYDDMTMIIMRYGLGGHKKSTFDKIGKQFGVKREAARKRFYSSLDRLRESVG
jgi:RNA polymerase sigma factor (sigma-70 family)